MLTSNESYTLGNTIYEKGGVVSPSPVNELIPAMTSFNRTYQEANLQPNFKLLETSFGNNTDLTPIVTAIKICPLPC